MEDVLEVRLGRLSVVEVRAKLGNGVLNFGTIFSFEESLLSFDAVDSLWTLPFNLFLLSLDQEFSFGLNSWLVAGGSLRSKAVAMRS